MKIRGSIIVSITIAIPAVVSTTGVSQATKNSEDAGATEPLPIVHFKFETEKTPVVFPSPNAAGLPMCGFSDSALLIHFMTEPDYLTQGMYAISPGKPVHTLAIPAPDDPNLQRFFRESDVNESGAYMLTSLSNRIGKGYPRTLVDMAADPKNYEILRFDDQGQLKETIHMGVRFRPMHFGVFPDGKLLVMGMDDVNLTPQAAILQGDGSFVASVDLWNALPSNAALEASVPKSYKMPDEFKLTMGLSPYRIWHTPLGLALMSREDITNRIIVINSAGSVSTVTPKLPKGYTVASLVQSDSRWLARVGGPENTPETVPKYDIYEFRPDDGVLIRKLDLTPTPGVGAACERNGEFRLIHWIDKKSYLETARPQ